MPNSNPTFTTTHTETLNPGDKSLLYKHETTYTPSRESGSYRTHGRAKELEINDEGEKFTVCVDQRSTPSDHDEDRWRDIEIPREQMIEIHRWLTERLYG